MKRNFVYSSSRMEAGRPVVRLSTQYHFDDGFTPPRIAFVGADPTDPDSIPIHEHVHTSGARLYSAAGTCGGDWQQGMLAFHSYGSAGAGRVEVLPGILHAGPTPVFVMAPEAAYRAVAGLERTSDGCGFYVQAYDPARWMEQTPAIHTKKLRHICLPCSHDAGTAKMQDIKTSDNGDDIAGFMNSLREIGDAIKATGIGIIIDIPLWLSNKLFGLVKGLGRAQSQSIADQLNGGVRGFDLRAYYYANDDEFYTYHGALAEKLETILDEMKAFLEATAGEILYVTFTHQQHVDTQALKDRLTTMIQAKLGSHAYLRDGTNDDTLFEQSYNDIVGQGSRGSKVVIVYSNSTDNAYWPSKYTSQGSSDVIDGYYSNSTDVETMLKDQINNYNEAVSNDLPFALYMTLTPQESDVYGRSAAAIAGPLAVAALPVLAIPFYGAVVFAAVEALCAGLAIYGAALSWHTLEELTEKLSPTLVQRVQDNFVPASGPNRVSLLWLDFYEKTGVVDLAVTLSQRS
jgi:hypothetical protein